MPVQFAITTLNWLDSYGSLSSSLVCRKKLSLRYGCSLVNVSNTSSLLPSLRISRGIEPIALRSTGKCATVPAMPRYDGPTSVSTLKILVLSSKRFASRVSPNVTSVSAAIATCPAFLTTTTVVILVFSPLVPRAADAALSSKHRAAEVRQYSAQITVEPCCRGAVDHPVVPRQRQRKDE